ncbi:RHS repeat-associated core domain-containing protein [Glaciecola siphonariae]|uniref:RHS repeat-associated core domain-containing protein n=1 Tax=Glaciecola siphonariae TaxID=521012 RepID=A0ABV9M0X0_9ALTE
MNGRIYDYNIGRFLSVDPFIQGTGSQSINPYSYLMNRPLAGTDPSGYEAEIEVADYIITCGAGVCPNSSGNSGGDSGGDGKTGNGNNGDESNDESNSNGKDDSPKLPNPSEIVEVGSQQSIANKSASSPVNNGIGALSHFNGGGGAATSGESDSTLDSIQTGLDFFGMLPVIGEVADLANAGISLARGDYQGAALSLAAMVPIVGNAATGVKLARKATKVRGGAKRGPKTDPDAPHNKKIREVGDQIEAAGGVVIAGGGRLPEQLVRTPGGNKSGRRPDILYQDCNGMLCGINVGKTKADGSPIKREQQALDDLNNAGLPTRFEQYD